MKRSNVTLADIARWRKQGRGCGEGRDYKPWLRVRDVPSKGRSSRIKGMKTHRVHHLLSDLETKHFLHLDFNPQVTDIREQYPLFPLGQPIAIANSLGISYPRYPGTNTPFVLTTDFLVTFRNQKGELSKFARTIKYREELSDDRALEKLEIERVFWKLQEIPWQVDTEDLNKTLVTNLNWLRPHLHLVKTSQAIEKLPKFLGALRIRLEGHETLKDLIKFASNDANLLYQEGMLYFRFLAWHRVIEIDLESTLLDLRSPLQITSFHAIEDASDHKERKIA